MKSGAPAADGTTDIEPPQNTEGIQYVEHKSYLTLEIQLARPMVMYQNSLANTYYTH